MFKSNSQVVREIDGRDPKAGARDFSDSVSLTRQSEQSSCDINLLLKRFGVFPAPAPRAAVGSYGDFSTVGDYLDAQTRLLTAREQFDSLPSEVRARFRHNPAELLIFLSDKSNMAQARAWGLLKDVDKPPADAVDKPAGGESKSGS